MAQVYAAEIRTYELNIGRSTPGSAEFGRSWERYIRLNLDPGRFGDGVRIAELNFFEDARQVPVRENGVRSNDSLLKLFMPIADFRDVYDVLRSEKPLNLLWQQKEPGGSLTGINSWRITSSREPLGEGDSES